MTKLSSYMKFLRSKYLPNYLSLKKHEPGFPNILWLPANDNVIIKKEFVHPAYEDIRHSRHNVSSSACLKRFGRNTY